MKKILTFFLFLLFGNIVNAQGIAYQYTTNQRVLNPYAGLLNNAFNYSNNTFSYFASGFNAAGYPYFYLYQNPNNYIVPFSNLGNNPNFYNNYGRPPVSQPPLYLNQWNSMVTPSGYRPYANPYFQMATQGIGGY
jgi:hypothetical protein